jgi:hypothetical protein
MQETCAQSLFYTPAKWGAKRDDMAGAGRTWPGVFRAIAILKQRKHSDEDGPSKRPNNSRDVTDFGWLVGVTIPECPFFSCVWIMIIHKLQYCQIYDDNSYSGL